MYSKSRDCRGGWYRQGSYDGVAVPEERNVRTPDISGLRHSEQASSDLSPCSQRQDIPSEGTLTFEIAMISLMSHD